MTAPATLRPATVADVDALLDVVHAAYRGDSGAGWTTEADLLDGTRTTPELLAATVADPAVRMLVAEGPDGELLGCAAVTLEEAEAGFGTFAVRPDRQGSGLGATLLAAGEEYARAAGASTMTMWVLGVRAELLDYYRRRGYVPTGATQAFPYGDERYGRPRRDDLEFLELAKPLVG